MERRPLVRGTCPARLRSRGPSSSDESEEASMPRVEEASLPRVEEASQGVQAEACACTERADEVCAR